MKDKLTRRGFVRAAAAGSILFTGLKAKKVTTTAIGRPAILGGAPAHTGSWPPWPEWRRSWEPRILDILRSGHWYRGSGSGSIAEFETGYLRTYCWRIAFRSTRLSRRFARFILTALLWHRPRQEPDRRQASVGGPARQPVLVPCRRGEHNYRRILVPWQTER